mmetsp:Transcript_16400/g.24311  ORF Transcript_16400/g.24311 Transcript_16400/m.24311 type:complete len:156 (+) Transcript_16400:262-729(+)
MATNNQPPPDLLSGSIRFAQTSMRFLGDAVGLIDSDDEDETEVGKEEENKLKGPPEDTLKLPDAARHRRELLAKKKRLKEGRQVKKAAGGVGGAIIGGLILAPVFPLGILIGGAAGAAITNKVSKHNEKRKIKKLDRRLLAQQEKQLKVDQTTLT